MNSAELITRLGRLPVVALFLRWYACRYREGSIVTIKHGSAGGYQWVRHHRYVNGYWIGHYELAIQKAITRYLNPGQTFFDLGANAGFFMLVAARRVGPNGSCVGFEPLPENVASIREQIELNSLKQCQVVPALVGAVEGSGTVSFDAEGSPKAHLGAPESWESSIEAKMTTVDLAAVTYGEPHMLKVDVEGQEVAVFQGASEILKRNRSTWLVEIHGPACAKGVREILSAVNYKIFTLEGNLISSKEPLPQHIIARSSLAY